MPLNQPNPATLCKAAILLSMFVSVHLQAAEHAIQCPSKIESTSILIVDVPEGWTSHVPNFFWLRTASPMASPPSRQAILIEDSYKKGRRQSVMEWSFLTADAYPEGKWLACHYGENNNITLARRIDDNATKCVVTHTHQHPDPDKIDVKCYW